jgi:hypothetical protein
MMLVARCYVVARASFAGVQGGQTRCFLLIRSTVVLLLATCLDPRSAQSLPMPCNRTNLGGSGTPVKVNDHVLNIQRYHDDQ